MPSFAPNVSWLYPELPFHERPAAVTKSGFQAIEFGFPSHADLDALDNEIIRLLTKNGRMSTGELAKKLNITAPTVRYRIKDLEENGIFRVSGLINPSKHSEMITAMVAMSVQSGGKLDQILEKISALPNVVWAGVVTGRYDIMAQVELPSRSPKLNPKESREHWLQKAGAPKPEM